MIGPRARVFRRLHTVAKLFLVGMLSGLPVGSVPAGQQLGTFDGWGAYGHPEAGCSGAQSSATFDGSEYTLSHEGGAGFSTNPDRPDDYTFAFCSVSGNFTLTARVVSQNLPTFGFQGLMVREGLDTQTRVSSIVDTKWTQHRSVAWGRPFGDNLKDMGCFRFSWLRIGRDGDDIIHQVSYDSVLWFTVRRDTWGDGSILNDSPAPDTLFVGLFVTFGAAEPADCVNPRGSTVTLADVSLDTENPPPIFEPTTGGALGIFEQSGAFGIPWASCPGLDGEWLTSYDGGSGEYLLSHEGGKGFGESGPDDYTFVHSAVSGDFTLTARVVDYAPNVNFGFGGLMVREALEHPSRFSSIAETKWTQDKNVAWGRPFGQNLRDMGWYRFEWIRIGRRGDDVTSFVSYDGAAWFEVRTDFWGDGSSGNGDPTPNTLLVGLYLVADREQQADCENPDDATVRLADVSLDLTPPTEGEPPQEGGQLGPVFTNSGAYGPAWAGCPGLAGQWSATFESDTGEYTLGHEGGKEMFASGPDEWTYVFKEVSGDFTLTAQLTDTTLPNFGSTGLMVRDSVDPFATTSAITETIWISPPRTVAWGRPFGNNLNAVGEAFPWLRIGRGGGEVIMLASRTGAIGSWVEIRRDLWESKSNTVGLYLASNHAKIADCSNPQNASVTFRNVSLQEGVSPVDVTTPTPFPGGQLPLGIFENAAALGPNLGCLNEVGQSAADYDAGTGEYFLGHEGGEKLFETDPMWPDEYVFAWNEVSGNFTLTARIIGQTLPIYGLQGLMIREDVGQFTDAGRRVTRTSAILDTMSTHHKTAAWGRPWGDNLDEMGHFRFEWLRIGRDGDTTVSQVSPDGSHWFTVRVDTWGNESGDTGSVHNAEPMPNTLLAGVFIAGNREGPNNCQAPQGASVTFSNVSVLVGAPPPAPYMRPNDTIPLGAFEDSGAFGVPGGFAGCPTLPGEWLATFDESTGEYVLGHEGGKDFGSIGPDDYTFAYANKTGDFKLTARLADTSNVPDFGLAGLMLREALEHGAKFSAVAEVKWDSPPQTVAWGRPFDDTIGALNTAFPWIQIERRGTDVISSRSSDGLNWTTIRVDDFGPKPSVVAGIFLVASHEAVADCFNPQDATVTFDDVFFGNPAQQAFRRGDANSDGDVNIADAIKIFSWLFQGGDRPACLDSADTDNTGSQDLTDGVFLLRFLFQGEASPPRPGPRTCGFDPEEGDTGCRSYPADC